MFGYIKPCRTKLSDSEFDIYKAYYCGLCKYINESYSIFSRVFLNYDCAFLYLVYSSLSDNEPEIKYEACAFNPFLKKQTAYSFEGIYSAGVNMLLISGKLYDDYADDKNILSGVLNGIYSPVFKKAKSRYFETAKEITSCLNRLSELEKNKCPSIDETSHEFALLLASTATLAPYDWLSGEVEQNLYDFAYNLGKWIYLIDAFCDLKQDLKKGAYNPIIYKYSFAGKDYDGFLKNILDDMEYNLMFSLKNASYYYSKLDFKRNVAILDNIMYCGLSGITKKALDEAGGTS